MSLICIFFKGCANHFLRKHVLSFPKKSYSTPWWLGGSRRCLKPLKVRKGPESLFTAPWFDTSSTIKKYAMRKISPCWLRPVLDYAGTKILIAYYSWPAREMMTCVASCADIRGHEDVNEEIFSGHWFQHSCGPALLSVPRTKLIADATSERATDLWQTAWRSLINEDLT